MIGPKISKVPPRKLNAVQVVDAWTEALQELFFIERPKYHKTDPRARMELKNFLKNSGIARIWIYYPWKKVLVRTVPENVYFKIRTARNRQVITARDQQKYRRVKVGIVGLSVGSAILEALVRTGGPKILKIADFDETEISNLNRIQAGLPDIGENKTEVAARRVWEVDPFADLHLWNRGISAANLQNFILGRPRLDIFIDEMDDLELKLAARRLCRKHRIPVLMATDNGDGFVLDVERFDSEPRRPLFHGLEKSLNKLNFKKLSYRQWAALATRIVGPSYLTPEMKKSLAQIGKTVSAVPQLGSGAMTAGAAVAYVVRRIANNQKVASGKYAVSLEKLFR